MYLVHFLPTALSSDAHMPLNPWMRSKFERLTKGNDGFKVARFQEVEARIRTFFKRGIPTTVLQKTWAPPVPTSPSNDKVSDNRQTHSEQQHSNPRIPVKRRHTAHSAHASASAVVTFRVRGTHTFALANSQGLPGNHQKHELAL